MRTLAFWIAAVLSVLAGGAGDRLPAVIFLATALVILALPRGRP